MNVSDSKLYVSPMVANDLCLEAGDKKNRNANWTDHEVISFLEILQEDEVLKDLSANRNKQVGLESVYSLFAIIQSTFYRLIKGQHCVLKENI